MEKSNILHLKGRQDTQFYNIDTSIEKCERFGLFHNDILIDLNNNKKIKVIGVCNNYLFCEKEEDEGVSYWDDVQCYDDFISKGIILEQNLQNEEIIKDKKYNNVINEKKYDDVAVNNKEIINDFYLDGNLSIEI